MTTLEGLVVQARIPVSPASLDHRPARFLAEVKKALREARKRYPPEQYQLYEIGFLPKKDFIEVKLYFRR